MTERWLPVVGWEGWYEVSESGKIRRVARSTNSKPGGVLSQWPDKYGQFWTRLCKNNEPRTLEVRILVAQSFLGPVPERMHVTHRDGNKRNNHYRNLEYKPYADDLPGEEWKSVVGWEGVYAVSDQGRVRRVRKGHGATHGKILKDKRRSSPYPSVVLYEKGRKRQVAVHILVAEAFLGPCPEGFEVNHKDGVKARSCLENLEYVTSSENKKHAYGIGLRKSQVGENNCHGALTEEDVIAIRRLYRKLGRAEIAERFNITPGHAYVIAARKRVWLHVP